MTSYLNNGYDVTKYFAKFETFIPHSIIMPSFMTVGSQMPELDWGAFLPYKIGCQNTPYKLGLKKNQCCLACQGLSAHWQESFFRKFCTIG